MHQAIFGNELWLKEALVLTCNVFMLASYQAQICSSWHWTQHVLSMWRSSKSVGGQLHRLSYRQSSYTKASYVSVDYNVSERIETSPFKRGEVQGSR